MTMTDHRRPWRIRSFARVRATASAMRDVLLRIKCDLAVWSDVRSFPALAILAGLDCVAVLILLRERSGRLPLRLANIRLCGAALAAAALTIASRWFLARIEREKPALWIRSLLAALSVLPLVALLTTATSRNSPWAISLVSALAVMAGNINLLWSRRSAARGAGNGTRESSVEATRNSHEFRDTSFDDRGEIDSPANPRLAVVGSGTRAVISSGTRESSFRDAAADEWIERTTDLAGRATFRGQMIAQFAAGQSVAAVHIPFVPAFERVPEFSCDVVDQPSIRSRTPAVYRYGARVEVKRAGETSNAIRAEIRFEARAIAQSSRAA
jgi:hypothetical protein